MLQRIAFAWTAVLLAVLAPGNAGAEAIKLKLAFYSSDQAMIFRAAVKPFVDVVNAEAKGLLEIAVYPAGALGKSVSEQHRIIPRLGNRTRFRYARSIQYKGAEVFVTELPDPRTVSEASPALSHRRRSGLERINFKTLLS